ncbi:MULTISPECIES: hypothetical protein [Microcoleaceae]|uniref:hypothetical protein n=1 Tax=Microcoleaceae TaxID=1892252 RepID=UPI001D13FF2F|nr:hypothetical protein [Tychonema sp. LEGE 06208]
MASSSSNPLNWISIKSLIATNQNKRQSLFRTHPSTEEQIQRLLTLAQQQQSAPVMAYAIGI